MKIFFSCRFGLGDILACYLSPTNYRRPNLRARWLMRLRNACRAGACTSAFAVCRFDFWAAMDFGVRVRSPASFQPPLAGNGWGLDELDGHRNLLTNPPEALMDFPADEPVPLPMRRPWAVVPDNYILFSDGAGAADRALDDPRIVEWLARYMPVVRVGLGAGSGDLPMGPPGATAAQLDLANATDLTEVFWLARHARLIVAPCTYLRTMAALVGTPVVELLQVARAEAETVSRTVTEYCGYEYGMSPGRRNFWCFWGGAPSAEAARLAEVLLCRPARGRLAAVALTASAGPA
jgi:hypothetical protein